MSNSLSAPAAARTQTPLETEATLNASSGVLVRENNRLAANTAQDTTETQSQVKTATIGCMRSILVRTIRTLLLYPCLLYIPLIIECRPHSSDTISSLCRAFCTVQRGGLGNPLSHLKRKGGATASGADTNRAARQRRSIVWASGSALSRVLEVGVIDLEAELEERRGCQKEISARISGPFPCLCSVPVRIDLLCLTFADSAVPRVRADMRSAIMSESQSQSR